MIMKNTFLVLIAIISLVACKDKDTSQLDRLKAESRTLIEYQIEKNKEIALFKAHLNDIQSNLEKIKSKEASLSAWVDDDDLENSGGILSDLETIQELMDENRFKIGKLNNILKGKDKKLNQYQTSLKIIQDDFESQGHRLETLSCEIADREIEIGLLALEQIKTLEAVEQLNNEMNEAWFAYGTFKELAEKDVAIKKGGILGLGAVKTLNEDFNQEYFTKVDIRNTEVIPLYCTEAKLLSSHPKDSYRFVGTDKIDSIKILDSEKFWATSKHLAIITQ